METADAIFPSDIALRQACISDRTIRHGDDSYAVASQGFCSPNRSHGYVQESGSWLSQGSLPAASTKDLLRNAEWRLAFPLPLSHALRSFQIIQQTSGIARMLKRNLTPILADLIVHSTGGYIDVGRKLTGRNSHRLRGMNEHGPHQVGDLTGGRWSAYGGCPWCGCGGTLLPWPPASANKARLRPSCQALRSDTEGVSLGYSAREVLGGMRLITRWKRGGWPTSSLSTEIRPATSRCCRR